MACTYDYVNAGADIMESAVACWQSEIAPSSLRGQDGKPLVVYFIRHAEAQHNVEEKRVAKKASDAGKTQEQVELARKAALWEDTSLLDAPLSDGGVLQVGASALGIERMLTETHVR